MKICHISDTHGYFNQLPVADIYFHTGDALPNFPVGGDRYGRIIRTHEEEKQQQWINDFGDVRKLLGNTEAPVVCVKGNHDFIDIGDLFSPPVFEINTPDDVFSFFDKENNINWNITGFAGVPPINGVWNTEMSEQAIDILCSQIKLTGNDIILTHCPPNGILDGSGPWSHYGSYKYREWLSKNRPRAIFFGHVHEQGGKKIIIDWEKNEITEQLSPVENRTLCSNAATSKTTTYLSSHRNA